MLPAPGPGNRRLVLRVRPRHLPGLHDVPPRRDPVPRPLRPGAGHATGRAERPAARQQDRNRDEDADRDQRRDLPAPACRRRAGQRERRLDLRARCPLHPEDRLERPGRRPRRGRVVPAAHGRLPPLRADPPRDEHARALVDRPPARGLARAAAVPPALSRLRTRRLCRGAGRQSWCGHRRSFGRDLRDPRRGDRARTAGHLRARGQCAHAADRQHRLHLRGPRDLDRGSPRRPRRRRALHPRLLPVRQAQRRLRPHGRPLDRQHRRRRAAQPRGRVLEGPRLRRRARRYVSRRSRPRPRCPARPTRPGRRRAARAGRGTGCSSRSRARAGGRRRPTSPRRRARRRSRA